MALSNNIHAIIIIEIIFNVKNFDYFKEDQLNEAFNNMLASITGIDDVADDGDATAVTDFSPVPTVLVSAKCALCIKVASIAYHYYILIGRFITTSNMNYTNVCIYKGSMDVVIGHRWSPLMLARINGKNPRIQRASYL